MTSPDHSQNSNRNHHHKTSTTITNHRFGRKNPDSSPLTHPAVVTNNNNPTTPDMNQKSSPTHWIQMVRQNSNQKKSLKVKRNSWRNDDFDDDDQYYSTNSTATTKNASSTPVTWAHLIHLSFRLMMGATITLYVLNQKHLLPKPLSSVVSRTLFWPTLPITVSRRIGKWVSNVDDTVIMGGAPFGFCNIPDKLYDLYGVSLL